MAYDSTQQRPYNGPAAQRPVHRQGPPLPQYNDAQIDQYDHYPDQSLEGGYYEEQAGRGQSNVHHNARPQPQQPQRPQPSSRDEHYYRGHLGPQSGARGVIPPGRSNVIGPPRGDGGGGNGRGGFLQGPVAGPGIGGRGYPAPGSGRGGRPGPPPGANHPGPPQALPEVGAFVDGPFPTMTGRETESSLDCEAQIVPQLTGLDLDESPRHQGQEQYPRRWDSQQPEEHPNCIASSQHGHFGPSTSLGWPSQQHPSQRRGPPPGPVPGPDSDQYRTPQDGLWDQGNWDAGYGSPQFEFGAPHRSATFPISGQDGGSMLPHRTDSMPINSLSSGPHRNSNPELNPGGQATPGAYDGHAHQRSSMDNYGQSGGSLETVQSHAAARPVNRAQSQPNMRQQADTVYETPKDAPPLPIPETGLFQPWRPGMVAPAFGSPAPSQAAISSAQNMDSLPVSDQPDRLPAHPVPFRPGTMIDPSGRPAPVRNYGGTSNSPSSSSFSVSTAPSVVARTLSQGKPPPFRNYSGVPASNSSAPSSAAGRQESQKKTAPVTSEELERLRLRYKAEPGDSETALTLGKKLLEACDVLVPNHPDPKYRARIRGRFAADALKVLKKLSTAEAMFVCAEAHGRGLLTGEPDHKEAYALYQSAAKMGHAAAAYRTAVCSEIGNEEGGGTRKDPLKAIQWYKRAATLGDTPAMYKIGIILLKGLLGQQRNPREAVSWLKRAAERADSDNPHALHELGLLHESASPNDVIVRDPAYALELFHQAAELGYKFSQFRLGCAYEYGLMGAPIDARASIMWYSKAAMQEEHQAELALSGWYLTGSDGVLGQSDTEAYLWARKAALAGLPKAEYAMGYFTEMGIGVAPSMEDAKRWYWRAASQDFPKARERLEDIKRSGKGGSRPRERISRNKNQQEGECVVM